MSDETTAVVHSRRPTEKAAELGEAIGRLKMLRKQAEQERDAAIRERDEAKAEAVKAKKDYDAAPLKLEMEKLKQEMRDRTHRSTFDKIAAEKGVAPDALELVYKHSGYTAEGDAADEKVIGTLLDGLKAQPGVARLFGDATPPSTPANGRGQGSPSADHGAKFRVTRAQLQDPIWCLENNAKRSRAIREKTLEIVD